MGYRNVAILGVSQALAGAAVPLITLIGGVVWTEIAPSPKFATVPQALIVVGVALCTFPAAFVMKRVGRRAGFMGATALAILNALIAAYALHIRSFPLFCLCMVFIGATGSFVNQFRFAAIESVDANRTSRAVSLVLLGGIAGGFLGPEIGRRTRDLLPFGHYTGSFVCLALIYLLVVCLLSFLRLPGVKAQEGGATGAERPLSAIVRQPVYLVALLAGVCGYGVMTFLMTATPIAMHVHDGFSMDATAVVIQSHVFAMFVPSLFAGLLIERFGAPKIMMVGVGAMATCVALAAASHQYMNYWGALVLLGVGWNFLYVGGTILLTRTYQPAELFKAQAANDFTVFGIQATASLTAGTIIQALDWSRMVLLVLPLLAVMLVALIVVQWRFTRGAPLHAA